ncbi:hypothetical protein NHX12_001938 [Muraenolepis orangiensis]|uniref:Helicase ATP-binding domain-containing protein n=1 Tax=Muraenolepis orangiensis TaxID=630683 RepID=A0A9Q0E3H4_9TELE|nr:hypothetical protein NHX12_001938 [Muraenolepis orangiensis]
MSPPRLTGALRCFSSVSKKEDLGAQVYDLKSKRLKRQELFARQGLTWQKVVQFCTQHRDKAQQQSTSQDLKNILAAARQIVGAENGQEAVESAGVFLFETFHNKDHSPVEDFVRAQSAARDPQRAVSFGRNIAFSYDGYTLDPPDLPWAAALQDEAGPDFSSFLSGHQAGRGGGQADVSASGTPGDGHSAVDGAILREEVEKYLDGGNMISSSPEELCTSLFEMLASYKSDDELQNERRAAVVDSLLSMPPDRPGCLPGEKPPRRHRVIAIATLPRPLSTVPQEEQEYVMPSGRSVTPRSVFRHPGGQQRPPLTVHVYVMTRSVDTLERGGKRRLQTQLEVLLAGGEVFTGSSCSRVKKFTCQAAFEISAALTARAFVFSAPIRRLFFRVLCAVPRPRIPGVHTADAPGDSRASWGADSSDRVSTGLPVGSRAVSGHEGSWPTACKTSSGGEAGKPTFGCQVTIQSEQEKQLMKEMRSQREQALLTARREPVLGRERVYERVRYPNVYDCYTEAAKSPAFVGGAKLLLPEGIKRENNKMYEEVEIPASEPMGIGFQEKPIYISELDQIGQVVFKGMERLNRIQSIVFETAYNTNENMLICAPTGAGKTNIAMLAVLHEVRQHLQPGGTIKTDQFKIVYVAPMKALAAEMTNYFSKRLQPLGISVKELTGDMQLTKGEIMRTQVRFSTDHMLNPEQQMLVTTPEKWDVVTRKSVGDVALSQIVRLLILDEVHLLHEDRGPVLESLVARTIRQGIAWEGPAAQTPLLERALQKTLRRALEKVLPTVLNQVLNKVLKPALNKVLNQILNKVLNQVLNKAWSVSAMSNGYKEDGRGKGLVDGIVISQML